MVCKYCSQDYPEETFPIANTIKGKTYRRKKCNYCYLQTKKLYKQNKRNLLAEYKKTQTCAHCGSLDYRTFEFHHTSNNKEGNISELISDVSWKNLQEEIKKCIVLCANCHRILHYKE